MHELCGIAPLNPDIMQPQSKQAKTKNHFRRLK
jgi:hypothetical protein